MKTHSIPRNVVAVLSCCAITLLGGWIGNSPSSAPPNQSHIGQSKYPKDSSKWDSASWSGRVVVGEYGTARSCFFCQPDDNLFNELLHNYPAKVFISLAYHTGIGVPLTDGADSTTPSLFNWYGFDGGDFYKQYASKKKPFFSKEKSFNRWIDGVSRSDDSTDMAVASELRRPPEAFFHVQTKVLTKGRLLVRVKVDSVSKGHPKGFLRIVLAEDTVNLIGDGKKLELMPRLVHHMVVRAFARTKTLTMGLPLRVPGANEWTFDVAAIQARHLSYHRQGIKAMVVRPGMWNGSTGDWDPKTKEEMLANIAQFPDERDWTMDPLRLHVVAFVQDAESGEVLQTVMVNLDPKEAEQLLPPKILPRWSGTPADSVWMNKWGYKYLSY